MNLTGLTWRPVYLFKKASELLCARPESSGPL